ncbi:hypothetical protein [Streptomyces abikoensis]
MTTSVPATPAFAVTRPLPETVPISRLKPGDTFAFLEAPAPLTVNGTKPAPDDDGYLLLDLAEDPQPLCIWEGELIRPLRLPRVYLLHCQICEQGTHAHVDLVAHGQPELLICKRH